jgi:DNA-binding LacI/PurR family transcriptional regulator
MAHNKRITSSDVAKRAGVSRATVSAVINNSRPVSDQLRNRVKAVMVELNYQPDAIARSLKGRKSNRIGVVVGNSGSPFWALVVNAIEDVAYANGYHVMLGDSGENSEKEKAHLDIMSAERVDGIIVGPCGNANLEAIKRLVLEIPVVLFDRCFNVPINTVACDNVQGAYKATSHFIDNLGYDRIACITISLEISPGQQRLQGYKKALSDHDIGLIEEYIQEGNYTEKSGYQCALELLRLPTPPRAIFASSHLQAVGVLRAAKELGLRIPQDIALIGFDDMPWAEYLSPPLTVVSQPISEMAARSANILLRSIDERADRRNRNDIVEQLIYQPKLVVRDSCGAKMPDLREQSDN